MKYLNYKILLSSVIFMLLSYMSQAQKGDSFFEDVAIINVIAVEKPDGNFYYEITLRDFSGKNQLPEGFGLNGHTFMDNGNYNDNIANDGVYTAKEESPIRELRQHPITNTVYYDTNFKYQNEIDIGQRGIGCKFRRCGCPCPTGTCPACEYLGWDCWEAYECEVIITI